LDFDQWRPPSLLLLASTCQKSRLISPLRDRNMGWCSHWSCDRRQVPSSQNPNVFPRISSTSCTRTAHGAPRPSWVIQQGPLQVVVRTGRLLVLLYHYRGKIQYKLPCSVRAGFPGIMLWHILSIEMSAKLWEPMNSYITYLILPAFLLLFAST